MIQPESTGTLTGHTVNGIIHTYQTYVEEGGDPVARNKYPEVTVEKILDVAQRLFLEKGYDNTTIQDIVDHLDGLSKGAVYHHFKSKEEIMDAVGDRMFSANNPFEKVRKAMTRQYLKN